MKRVITGLMVGSILVLGMQAHAQEEEAIQDNSLQGRFQEMRTKSQTYNDYKVIKISTLDAFWRATKDTLQSERKHITELQGQVVSRDSALVALRQQITEKEASIEGLVHDSAHNKVLGIDFSKTTFNFLVLGVVLVLGATIGFLYFKAARCTSIAENKSRAFEKIHDDFEEYKRAALEKQMRLRRELQTERNKLAEMGR
jgi:hypothetical protein